MKGYFMPKVKFVNEKKEIEVPEGSNLREEARKAGVEVYKGMSRYAHCPGVGMCGTCRVVVKEGQENLNSTTLREKLLFNLHPLVMFAAIGQENMRLSCQVEVNGDCVVETAPDFMSGENFWQKPYPNK